MKYISSYDKDAVINWLLSGTTGASAESILSFLTARAERWPSYPHDGGDFERCERFLEMCPDFQQPFRDHMHKASSYWSALVPKWAEISGLEMRGKSDLIRSIVRPIQDKDPRVLRFGEGAFFTFSKGDE